MQKHDKTCPCARLLPEVQLSLPGIPPLPRYPLLDTRSLGETTEKPVTSENDNQYFLFPVDRAGECK